MVPPAGRTFQRLNVPGRSDKGSAVRQDSHEVGGKSLDHVTGSGYESSVRDERAKIFKVQNLYEAHELTSDGHKAEGV